jgi:uncharacterized protein YecE (DUF72 family)
MKPAWTDLMIPAGEHDERPERCPTTMDTGLPNLLPPEDDHWPAQLARRLAALAAQGIYLGTSSWKYPGWLGGLYTEDRYRYRGKLSDTRFQQHCLEEYATVFPTVGVDATYYTFPTEKFARGLVAQVPAHFRFSFKVTDHVTVKRYPPLPRHGEFAGQPNPGFLDAELFRREFLDPLQPIRDSVGLIMFEFSRFHAQDFARGRDFVAALDHFLGDLPGGWRYGVEVRNRSFLHPDFFALLAAHGVTYLFNQWSDGPSLDAQLAQPGCWTAHFAGTRLLTRPGTNYEEREQQLQPFDRVREPFPEARAATVRLIREARQRGLPLFAYLGNKLEGCATLTVATLVDELADDGAAAA